jgi:hypothetical protein
MQNDNAAQYRAPIPQSDRSAITNPSNQPSAATRRKGGGQPTPHEHDRRDEQPRHHDHAEQGEQWQHGERATKP